jgi:ParB family chromosome partitioning protein
VAGCLARDKFLLDQHHGDEVAAKLLGVEDGAAIRKLVDSLGIGGDTRAQMITLALVLGSMEARKDAWRSATGGALRVGHATTYTAHYARRGDSASGVRRERR